MRRGRHFVVGAVLAALVALAAVVLLEWLRREREARAAFPRVGGILSVEGSSEPIEILRDSHGIPHVEARTSDDALFGLGFVHAQDRLGQMMWLLRAARGRTAEAIGAEGLPADRLARTLGLGALADAAAERLDPATRRALEAYAAGVNAHLARIQSGDVGAPALARRLGLEIERWRPADSLAVLKLYAWSLADTVEVHLVLDELITKLGGFGALRFFPSGSGEHVLPAPDRLPFTAGVGRDRRPRAPGVWRDPLRRTAGLEGRSAGSSAWVLGGAHAEGGLPLLAADVHLEPTAPPLLHWDHVRGGDLDVAGATLPGLPGVWTGRNRRVAWATTHARASVTDVYEEKVHRDDPGLYHDGPGWRRFDEREETVEVRGGEAVTLTVRATRRGPVLEELLDEPETAFSMAWTGMRPGGGETVAALLAVARAADAAALRAALARLREPAVAVVYADAEGAAGLQVAGWIPRRPLPTGLVPVQGRARWFQWQGPIPFAQLPSRSLSAGRGWVIAADNRFTQPGGGEETEWLWRSGARAGRIDGLLRAVVGEGLVTLRQMAELQSDVEEPRGRELVEAALELARGGDAPGGEELEVIEILSDWDGRSSAESVGAAAYHAFLATFTEKLLAPHLGAELLHRYLALPQVDPGQVVLEIVRETLGGGGDGPWSDRDAMAEVVRLSLRETWYTLSHRLGANRSKWRWGILHPLYFRSFGPQDGAPPPLGPFPLGGSGVTVSVGDYDPADPFAVRMVSALRFAVDAGAPDQALVGLAPGQSEHPGHPDHDGGLEGWLSGRAVLLATSRLLVEESGATRLVLEPAP